MRMFSHPIFLMMISEKAKRRRDGEEKEERVGESGIRYLVTHSNGWEMIIIPRNLREFKSRDMK